MQKFECSISRIKKLKGSNSLFETEEEQNFYRNSAGHERVTAYRKLQTL